MKTKCVAIDFTGGPEIYAKIKKEIENLDVGVLGKIFLSFNGSFKLNFILVVIYYRNGYHQYLRKGRLIWETWG